MCGVAGYYGTREISERALEGCLATMRRRGPDHADWRHFRNSAGRNAYLLNTRLSVIDLDARSNQPFHVGSKWLTYNGELYNHLEIRDELTAAGVRFTTASDTEVLLRGIDARGWQALDTFEGMWAFGLYDADNGVLSLCRDRFGEKPLYVHRDESGIYFGSEPKFIVSLLGHALGVDIQQVYRYLVNGYKALHKKDRTFFEGLTEVPPGTMLQVDVEGREQTNRYWRPQFCPDDSMSYQAAVSGARDRLIRAVEFRLRADVPLAFCMSGGIDSNALISIAKRVFGYDVHGFTVATGDARYDEREMVEHAVSDLSIRHTAVPLSPHGFLDELRTLVRYHDGPVSTTSYFAHWRLMEQIAHQGYRVSVSGTGADELFTGYYDHHLAYLYEVREDKALATAARRSWGEHVAPVVRNPLLGNPDMFVDDPGCRAHIFFDATRFASWLVAPWSEEFEEERYTDSLLRNRMLNEMFHEAVPVILHEDDLNAMYFSVENRSPFLDRALFEFCYRIPTRHLVRNGFAKAVLRDAMEGIVPEAVRMNRKKVGFNVPVMALLDPRAPAVRDAVLADGPIFEHVRRDKIEMLLDTTDLPNSESKFLFNFVNSKIFLEECGR